jgi:TetR/AcrR family transcriptional regulator, regulator of cefoperazone and chloramphenicol sensitivity
MQTAKAKAKDKKLATRQALLASATALFAEHGYKAVSLHDVAQRAGVNTALISYYFESKEGLYLAVFDDISTQLGEKLQSKMEAIQSQLTSLPTSATPEAQRSHALALLLEVAVTMLHIMVRVEFKAWSQLIMREQQSPTAAFELLYGRVMGRLLGLMTQLVELAKAQDSQLSAPLFVVTLMGQLMVCRAAHTGALLHLGWTQFGEAELEKVAGQIRWNVMSSLGFDPNAKDMIAHESALLLKPMDA